MNGTNPFQIRPADSKEAVERLVGHVGRGWRLARRVFHILVGIAFLFCASMGATLSLGEWKTYVEAPANGVWRFATIAGFTVLLLIFGLYSFVKARSVQ